MNAIKHALRTAMERRGWFVRNNSVLPYGIDYFHDVQRLSTTLRIPLKVFFDVGANIGQTANEVIRRFPNMKVFSFEPHASTFAALTENVKSDRISSYNVALSDKCGEATFFEYGATATCNSLVENSPYAARMQHSSKVTRVKCETLAHFCQEHAIEKIDVLKVDTEGHDLAVLKGAAELLTRNRIHFIFVEFNTIIPKPGTSGGGLAPLGALLEPLGFHLVATYPEYLIMTGQPFVACNALFVHAENRNGT